MRQEPVSRLTESVLRESFPYKEHVHFIPVLSKRGELHSKAYQSLQWQCYLQEQQMNQNFCSVHCGWDSSFRVLPAGDATAF
jgi:hypothetical protein